MAAYNPDPFAPELDTVILRYMDDRKFTDLLGRYTGLADWIPEKPGSKTVCYAEPGNLWFSYPSSLGDPSEGTHTAIGENPQAYVERVIEFMGLDEAVATRFRQRYLTSDNQKICNGIVCMAQLCGVSCWTAAADEDEDMWNLFGGSTNGVAIRSTCGQILESLANAHLAQRDSKPAVCAVGYIDHKTYFLPYDGFRGILSLVQSSWSFENEVRFVAKSPALAAIPMKLTKPGFVEGITWQELEAELGCIADDAIAALQRREVSGAKGFHLPVRLNGLMTEVVIQPDSESDYEESVKEQLRKVGLAEVSVRRSSV